MKKSTEIFSQQAQEECALLAFRVRDFLKKERFALADKQVSEAVSCIDLIVKQDEFDSLNPAADFTKKAKFEIGQLVEVSSRMFRGSNKEGGVGTVVKQHESGTVDVKYTLGGKEQKIPSHFVKVYKIEKVVPARRRGAQSPTSTCNSPGKNNEEVDSCSSIKKESLTGIRDALVSKKQYRKWHWGFDLATPKKDSITEPLPFTLDWESLMQDFREICVNAAKRYENDPHSDSSGSPYTESLRLLHVGYDLFWNSRKKSEAVIQDLLRQESMITEELYFRLGKKMIKEFPLGSHQASPQLAKESVDWVETNRTSVPLFEHYTPVELDFLQPYTATVTNGSAAKRRKATKTDPLHCRVHWPVVCSSETPVDPVAFCDELSDSVGISKQDAEFLKISIAAQLTERGVTW